MAGRGPTRRPDAERQRRHRPKALRVVDAAMAPAPAADPEWLAETAAAWAGFWTSGLAVLVVGPGEITLRRLFDLMDERRRVVDMLGTAGRVVTGSQGQAVLHPLVRDLRSLDAEIRQLEDRFGFSPRARLSLGVQSSEVRQSLEQLNAVLG